MSESNAGEEQLDNWVFDSLVNFLHGSIWKAPVVGFIEEKSVGKSKILSTAFFDPDSYNNMSTEKEEEFRKIHDEYKALVDFMLSRFMEDLQVTPEQVEDACRLREHQNKTLPESHITKVALEQLWAAEDFTAFRRLMTRKNIDLQLQSLELLVAKYGVLSPSLRSGDSEEPAGEDGEDDFLQVVIRYSDQLELFKCDYGADGICQGRNSCKPSATTGDKVKNDDESKNMKLHLSGIQFKNNVAPNPVKYQATLMSSSSSSMNCDAQNALSSSQDKPESDSTNQDDCKETGSQIVEPDTKIGSIEETETSSEIIPVRESASDEIQNTEHEKSSQKSPDHDHTPSPMISPHRSPTPPPAQPDSAIIEENTENAQNDTISEPTNSCIDLNTDNIPDTDKPEVEDEPESQLIQLEEAEAAIDEEFKLKLPELEERFAGEETETVEKEEPEEEKPESPKQAVSPHFDEKTAAEITITAPEQRRLLTAVRKALEVNPDESEPFKSIDIPKSFENDEDLQKRREYLRAQRDKLIAMKKQEREKLLMANSSAGGSQSSRPKSARAAQMAIKNPLNMRAASIGSNERSLSARRALADRLKQELIEKQ